MNIQKTWVMVASVVAFSLSMMFAPSQLVAESGSEEIERVGSQIFGKDFTADDPATFESKYDITQDHFRTNYAALKTKLDITTYKQDLNKKVNILKKITNTGRDYDWIDDTGYWVYGMTYFQGKTISTFRGSYAATLNSIGQDKVNEAFGMMLGKLSEKDARELLNNKGYFWNNKRKAFFQKVVDEAKAQGMQQEAPVLGDYLS